MLILILGFALIAFVVFLFLRVKYPKKNSYDFDVHDVFTILSVVFGLTFAGLIITICCLMPKVSTEKVIDNKIEMYQEENTNIEQDIDKIVKQYMEHEKDTFADLKPEESSITLVTLFPTLKSDTLVQKQLEIYINNNAKIKSLREEKIELTKIRWIIYFGS